MKNFNWKLEIGNWKFRRQADGYVALSSVLVIAAVVLVIGISVSLLSISESQMSLAEKKKEETIDFVESCLEDALLRINEDESYSGGTLSLPEGDCTINISQTGNDWTITAEGTLDGFTKTIEVQLERTSPTMALTSWQEIE